VLLDIVSESDIRLDSEHPFTTIKNAWGQPP
jgi:hypothetical protein